MRGTAMGVAVFGNWAANFAVAQTFPTPAQGALAPDRCFLGYAALGVLAWSVRQRRSSLRPRVAARKRSRPICNGPPGAKAAGGEPPTRRHLRIALPSPYEAAARDVGRVDPTRFG